ncbi:MAG: hypothetical protein ABW360_19560 [Phenylobacterium sp.]
MLRKLLALTAVAVLTMGAAPAAQKPAPKASAPRAAAPKAAPAAKAAPFDATDPASLITLLASLDAKAEVAGKQSDGVLLKVTSPAGGFQAAYGGCNAQGRACAALQFDASAQRGVTISQINDFNQSSLSCRIFQDRTGKPHVLYSTLVFASDSRQEMLTQIAAWRGCLGDFGAFLKDPPGYLASAP